MTPAERAIELALESAFRSRGAEIDRDTSRSAGSPVVNLATDLFDPAGECRFNTEAIALDAVAREVALALEHAGLLPHCPARNSRGQTHKGNENGKQRN